MDYREFSAAAYSLFDQLDRNGDGKITPEEFNPKAPAAMAEQYRQMPVQRRGQPGRGRLAAVPIGAAIA